MSAMLFMSFVWLWIATLTCVAAAFVVPRQHVTVSTRGVVGVTRDRRRLAASHEENGDESSMSPSSTTSLTRRTYGGRDDTVHNHVTTAAWHAKADDLWNQAWHDAFVRNGLVDFTPPLTDSLFCCMIGDDNHHHDGDDLPFFGGTPSHEDSGSFAVDLQISAAVVAGDATRHSNNVFVGEHASSSHRASSLTRLRQKAMEDPLAAGIASQGTFRYDCIFDTSLMNTILGRNGDESVWAPSSVLNDSFYEDDLFGGKDTMNVVLSTDDDDKVTEEPSSERYGSRCRRFADVQTLLDRATEALREHGIFVALTTRPPSAAVRAYLRQTGPAAGLQWQFDLDEINSDGTMYVSVARKYRTEDLPAVGTLTRPVASRDPSDRVGDEKLAP